MATQAVLELADWRQKVAALYLSDVDIDGFRAGREQLFHTHPQSPTRESPRYFAPDPAFIVEATIEAAEGSLTIGTGDTDGDVTYERVAILRTPFGPLTLWWIMAYGGGLFLPFRDSTCGAETYGGGRYLTDTVKGTFGRGLTIVNPGVARLDFNYAYNPSCAYSDAWVCPLAPRENWLDAPIRAGEAGSA
ncbi:DUF1684 domain-containing protein [Catelliglobosispora koreensis]|uniref:DUF1684 domain-containing protein n=1 Tax=Catelliglobosispora koreensis TaxID=129052 RepID=UPI0003775239|nr:DUF1684 domain-containing protein [Catelliglobosispora koreensis]